MSVRSPRALLLQRLIATGYVDPANLLLEVRVRMRLKERVRAKRLLRTGGCG